MERFNPCTTDACKTRCDKFGVACEEICVDEIERLRALIRAHVEASNNDDTAGATFGALMAEVPNT